MNLTNRQEKFVVGVAAGMTQRDAYKASYSAENMSEATIDQKASRLMATGKCRARLEALRAESAERVVWSREIAARDLLTIREIALAHIAQTKAHRANFTQTDAREIADLPRASISAVLASTAELNKMFGVYDAHDPSKDAVRIVDDIGGVDA